MNKFKKISTKINDLYLIEQTLENSNIYYDKHDFFDLNLTMNFIQDNESVSKRNVLRGLDLQINKPQGKLIRVLEGEIFDVAVDLRKKSKTFGKWESFILSNENKKQLYIPEGFAHGFLVLSENAKINFKVSNNWYPNDTIGILWKDKNINIEWPINKEEELIISEKDKNNKNLSKQDLLNKI